MKISGHGVGRGLIVGRAEVLAGSRVVGLTGLDSKRVEAELKRLKRALDRARTELRKLLHELPQSVPGEIVDVIEAHDLLLRDPEIERRVSALIRERQTTADWAFKLYRDELAQAFAGVEDAYLKQRAEDFAQVIDRAARSLGRPQSGVRDAPAILVARDLDPADFVLFARRGARAVVLGGGGPLSHTAIVARGLKLPAVLGVGADVELISPGMRLAVDVRAGQVHLNPSPRLLAKLEREQAHAPTPSKVGARWRWSGRSRDGCPIAVYINSESLADIAQAIQRGANGVGLYRSELVLTDRQTLPDEQTQFELYRAVLSAAAGMPVTIRSFDLGADKQFVDLPILRGAANPALSLRGIRLGLQLRELLLPQIRALIRAAQLGPIRIMLPMLSDLHEVSRVRALLSQHAAELGVTLIPELGGMVEIPAVALQARAFAKRLDFLSIGTNDLVQYTLAIDRDDERVANLFDPLNAAVLRLIQRTIRAGSQCSIGVSICGEMAADPEYAELLIGLGLREFSVHPAHFAEVAARIEKIDSVVAIGTARRLLRSVRPARELARIASERLSPSGRG